jgi:hypothetical protein
MVGDRDVRGQAAPIGLKTTLENRFVIRPKTWAQFAKVAYSPEKALQESGKDWSFRLHRWIGLRLAYFFYVLRVSGNALSVIRLGMTVLGVYLLAGIQRGETFLPTIGALLVYGQVILDFSDGALAKVSGGAYPELGDQFDFLGCDVARIALLTSLGLYAGSTQLALGTLSAAFVLVTFRPVAAQYVSASPRFYSLTWLTRWAMSDQWVVVIMPFVLVVLVLVPVQLPIIAASLAWFYVVLATIWVLLATRLRP